MALEISHWFPPELIREIMLKASVESLLQCKSVCKDWYSLISDQRFIKSHYTLSSTNNINYQHHRLIYTTTDEERNNLNSCPLYDVLFNGSVNNAIQLKNPFKLPRPYGFRIVGSCNGLVCVKVYVDNTTLFIYNPTTRRGNLLKPFQGTRSSRVCYGFGYDELSHDYKVVMTDVEHDMDTIMYSLKTGKWKAIGRFPYFRPLYNGHLLNGSLHWAAGKSTLSDSWKIVSLDLANETYGEVLQPEYDEGDCFKILRVSGEWLCVLCDYFKSCVLDVWLMKVYGMKDSWTKLPSISYPLGWGYISAPFCVSEDDGKLLLQYDENLAVYDLKDKSFPVIERECKCRDACIVVESLVSPFHL